MKTSLPIEGMSCENCAKHVKEALEEIQGVNSADVNLIKKTAEVEHNGGIDLEMLKIAVTEAGYTVTD